MRKICVIPGDGIGPEVMQACLDVLQAVTSEFRFVETQLGIESYKKCGKYLSEETTQIIQNTDACLFGAITTPPDPNYRSPLLALRQGMHLYANLRPVYQFLPDKKKVDIVIVRENTEDLYAGIEANHQGYAVAAKIVSREACERIIEFAIDYAKIHNRKKITCVHKANVLRKTDGLFASVFQEKMRNEEHLIGEELYVDTCALKLVTAPENFDMIVTLNLYGDILSDLAAGLIGGLGFAPSANLGESYAIFEPVHGSAPDIAGKGIANPTAMILSGAMMLDYFGFYEAADKIRNGIASLYAKGIKTKDIGGEIGTEKFTELLIKEIDMEK
ncbi:MAG: isocitrate/isopropylmalate dehydrogenase family protein [Thermoplasmata archaeon]